MRTTSHAYAAPDEAWQSDDQARIDLREALGEPWVNKAGPRDLVRDFIGGLGSHGASAVVDGLGRTPLLRLFLRGPIPDPVTLFPIDLVPGRVTVANALFTGVYSFDGTTMRATGRTPWSITPPDQAWAEALHGFSWLRHFRVAGGETATNQARALVSSWLESCGRWHNTAWQPHVTGRRVVSWLSNGRFLFEGSDLIWRYAVMRHLAQQVRFLHRTARLAPAGAPRFTVAIGLVLSGLCLSGGDKRLEGGLSLLKREIGLQILPDGGHISRDPSVLVAIFADLLGLKLTLEEADRPVPGYLSQAIDRMTPMVRFFRHGDGRLALFNGACESPDGFVDHLLSRAGQQGAPLRHARHSGYHRFAAGRTIVILDAGTAPPGRFATRVHASALAFEMSVGAHRLIVNCGSAENRDLVWRHAVRATAAHSTLGLADRSSGRFVIASPWRDVFGERALAGPMSVRSAREDGPDGIWAWASHDGYAAKFDLIHERRLYLNPDGSDLRGEDRLMPDPRRTPPATPQDFAVRFHLHPDVRCSLARDGQSVLLLLPNGDGWRFRASGGQIALEESVYLGRGESHRKSEQIVVSGTTDPGGDRDGAQPTSHQAQIKWAIHRLAPKTGGGARAAE